MTLIVRLVEAGLIVAAMAAGAVVLLIVCLWIDARIGRPWY